MAVLIAFLLGENSPFVGGPFHVADTVYKIYDLLANSMTICKDATRSEPRCSHVNPEHGAYPVRSRYGKMYLKQLDLQ
jgi:hypothetical protein